MGNVQELYNAVLQFEEENEDPSLLAFLANASLASDLDNMDEGNNRVSLMTLHSSKGLEFPVVFLVGLEQGLFPNHPLPGRPGRHGRRTSPLLRGHYPRQGAAVHFPCPRTPPLRQPRTRQPLPLSSAELPTDLITGNSSLMNLPQRMATPIRDARIGKMRAAAQPGSGAHEFDWNAGDVVVHPAYGAGEVTHIFGAGNKICLAMKFTQSRPQDH
jgi:DNA helicase-2/ATP-dependent DNA helicase PcrA